MKVFEKSLPGELHIALSGELDEKSASQIRSAVDKLIDNTPYDVVVFDLSAVTFMDSTGIGFIIGRYKKAARLGIKLFVQNPNSSADKVLSISGLYSLIQKR